MFFPPQLWTPGPKALAGTVLELITVRTQIVSAAAAAIQQNGPTVPIDYIELLHWWGFEVVMNGGQTLTNIQVLDAEAAAANGPVLLDQGINANDARHGNAFPGTGNASIGYSVPYVLMGGRFLRWSATFNAGVAVNTLRGVYQAWRIPRGQIGLLGP